MRDVQPEQTEWEHEEEMQSIETETEAAIQAEVLPPDEDLAARVASLTGALKRIIENRQLDPTLVKFCESVLDGSATFSDDGRPNQ